MRIIGGKYGGRLLPANIPKHVRPTTDIVREAIFNVLENYITLNGTIVLDLFAGTGCLGFEAISRGASKCFFVDSNFRSISYIRETALSIGLSTEQYMLFKSDTVRFLKNFTSFGKDGFFNLIFSDPPYRNKVSHSIIEEIVNSHIIKNDGIVVLEHRANEEAGIPSEFKLLKRRNFGSTGFEILIYNG